MGIVKKYLIRKIDELGAFTPFKLRNWRLIRLSILVSADVAVLTFAYWFAYYLRLDEIGFGEYFPSFIESLPIFVLAHLLVFVPLGMYRQVWRYANFSSAILIGKCALLGSLIATGLIYGLFENPFPRSVPVICWLITSMALTIEKFSWRTLLSFSSRIASDGERCLIYGAGSAGELFARHVSANPNFPYKIVGFVDDDRNKRGRLLHGFKIFGTGEDLEAVVKEHNVQKVILALHSAPGKVIRDVVEKCRKVGIIPLIMPDIANVLSTRIVQPRKIDIKDLLRRAPKSIDYEAIHRFFTNRVVVVTGAGGSIGSEICRQVMAFEPKKLILLDSTEYNLYHIEEELLRLNPRHKTEIVPVLGSATNERLVDSLFKRHRPSYVLHAAAYKHVPMLETNSIEGIRNNILATKVVAEAAVKHGTERFLLVSSDKAVRPTNVMGATKRCCELLIQAMHELHSEKCSFMAVRFGNVLGSSGSVIPKFLEQIQDGGPVTVTSRDVSRFFMLTSEAVGLVLQSIVFSRGGEIFVLNMGESINIYEMANQLIILSGKTPGKDIEIQVTKLRPGEKLHEELVLDGSESHTLHEDIFVAVPDKFDVPAFLKNIDSLLNEAHVADAETCRKSIYALINNDFKSAEKHLMEPLKVCEPEARV